MLTMKMARAGRNMTMEQVAAKMGVTVQTYSKWEKDPDGMSIKRAKAFAAIVDVPLEDIFFASNSK